MAQLLPFPEDAISERKAASTFTHLLAFTGIQKDLKQQMELLDILDSLIDAAVEDGDSFLIRAKSPVLQKNRFRIQHSLFALISSLHFDKNAEDQASRNSSVARHDFENSVLGSVSAVIDTSKHLSISLKGVFEVN